MPIQEMVANDSNLLVARALARGEGDEGALERLFREFPEEDYRSIYAALNRGREAFQAGQQLEALPEEDRPRLGDIPRTGGIVGGFRYTVLVEYTDPDSGKTAYKTTYVVSGSNLTRGQIEQGAETAFRALAARPAHIAPGYEELAEIGIAGTVIISAERD